ncbi:MAG: hypothetical protein KDA42_03775, partial [Planctomycetales bacterium]|nr:hypothetical protein [Planctomycetales bacterium]
MQRTWRLNLPCAALAAAMLAGCGEPRSVEPAAQTNPESPAAVAETTPQEAAPVTDEMNAAPDATVEPPVAAAADMNATETDVSPVAVDSPIAPLAVTNT